MIRIHRLIFSAVWNVIHTMNFFYGRPFFVHDANYVHVQLSMKFLGLSPFTITKKKWYICKQIYFTRKTINVARKLSLLFKFCSNWANAVSYKPPWGITIGIVTAYWLKTTNAFKHYCTKSLVKREITAFVYV